MLKYFEPSVLQSVFQLCSFTKEVFNFNTKKYIKSGFSLSVNKNNKNLKDLAIWTMKIVVDSAQT